MLEDLPITRDLLAKIRLAEGNPDAIGAITVNLLWAIARLEARVEGLAFDESGFERVEQAMQSAVEPPV